MKKAKKLDDKPSTRVRWVENWDDVYKLVEYCQITKVASVDFETSGQPVHNKTAYPTLLGISFQPGSAWIVPLGHKESPFRNKEEWIKVLQYIGREVIMNPAITKVAHNLKFEWKWFKHYGIDMIGILHDTMLAKYLLDENSKNDLKTITAIVMPQYAGYDDELQFLLKKAGNNWAEIPLHPLGSYCAMDCDMTLRLIGRFHQQLIQHNFYPLYRNLLMMASRVLAESEWHGMRVNPVYLDHIIEVYKDKIDTTRTKLLNHPRLRKYKQKRLKEYKKTLITKLKDEIADIMDGDSKQKARMLASRQEKILRITSGELTGKDETKFNEFNLGSPQQLVDFFYVSPHGLQFPAQTKKNKKTKKEGYTTDEEAIEKLKRLDVEDGGFLDALLELRGLEKIFATYMIGIRDIMDDNNFVHSNYKIHGTVTGRLSSSEPNMQNIPRIATNPDVKPMFEPPKGFLHYELDYGQAELRVVAELANDKVMLDIFKRGWNIHMGTACLLHGDLTIYDEARRIEKDDNHPDHMYWVRLKKQAKSINFGILYGRGARALAEELNIEERQAQKIIDDWLNSYPDIKKWMKKQVRFCMEEGYVMSIFGRRRRLEDIWNDTKWIREKAERDAVNAPVQGSASDFTLFSTVVIRELRLRGKLPAYLVQRATVHDAIDSYIKPKDIHWVNPIITSLCSKPDTLPYFGFELKKVSMKMSEGFGPNWADMKEDYDPNFDYEAMLQKRDKKVTT